VGHVPAALAKKKEKMVISGSWWDREYKNSAMVVGRGGPMALEQKGLRGKRFVKNMGGSAKSAEKTKISCDTKRTFCCRGVNHILETHRRFWTSNGNGTGFQPRGEGELSTVKTI